MMERRVVAAEALDHLAPQDPAAIRSRQDLIRVHRAMRTRGIVAQGWHSIVSPLRAGRPMRILEIGAGDGTLLLGVARSLAPRWPLVQLTLLDRVNIVEPATLAAYAELGWESHVMVADVLDWASSSQPGRWDLVSTALFLHHFEGPPLELLLTAIASRSDRFFACEPQRSWQALAGSYLVGALGANAVTREDAVLSVRAGFRAQELTLKWPQAGGPWRTREFPAGPFSHCFSACGTGTH